ncbi:hypothetical protein R1sor_016099 [Riccia sorocarpa]|uniref:Uncharacterized protein n=1 Tax=Riccia sorocarpa TaxID=122646 RepID=A0ABD3HE15_9MARC
MHPVPMLLEEVADYKSYVGGFLDKLEGHSKPIGFRFSMANNVPIYKFRVDGPCVPEGGHSLWKKRNGQFIFPNGEPSALPLPSTHPRLGEVSPFINNLITFLKDTYKDETSEGYRKYRSVVSYWERVKANLTSIQPLQEEKLQSGFWPQTNHGTGFMTDAQYEEGLRVEQDEPAPTLDELEKELQAENEMQLAVWLGCAMGAVVRDNNDEHHSQFLTEWWRPRHRKSTNATNKERYSSFLVGQKDWEKDPGYNTPHWINASVAIYSWKYRAKEAVPLITKLNPLAKAVIRSHFEMLDSNEGRELNWFLFSARCVPKVGSWRCVAMPAHGNASRIVCSWVMGSAHEAPHWDASS